MRIGKRLKDIETELAARRKAASDAVLAELKQWIAIHWSEAENEAWLAYLVHDTPRLSDAKYAELGMTRARVDELAASVPLPTPEGRALVEAAWARMPADLRHRLEST